MVNNNHDLIIISDPTDKFSIAGDGLLPHTGPGLAPVPQPGMGIFAMMGERQLGEIEAQREDILLMEVDGIGSNKNPATPGCLNLLELSLSFQGGKLTDNSEIFPATLGTMPVQIPTTTDQHLNGNGKSQSWQS